LECAFEGPESDALQARVRAQSLHSRLDSFQDQSTAAARNVVGAGENRAPEIAGGKVASEPKGRAVGGKFFHGIDVCFNGLSGGLEPHVQVLVGIGNGTQ